jgi:hypothetical protein
MHNALNRTKQAFPYLHDRLADVRIPRRGQAREQMVLNLPPHQSTLQQNSILAGKTAPGS